MSFTINTTRVCGSDVISALSATGPAIADFQQILPTLGDRRIPLSAHVQHYSSSDRRSRAGSLKDRENR
jgi:hypothetical protein